MQLWHIKPGVGPTEELRLRVSVAALTRVIFENPADGKTMLVLERTATLRTDKSKPEIIVKAKPFGGGVRLNKPLELKKHIGRYHYDSERSREQEDFRIMIDPGQWGKVKEICYEHLKENEMAILDPSPVRELEEEFEDSLDVRISEKEYELALKGMIVEDVAFDTDNVNARGLPTVRVYYIFEARLTNPELISKIIDNSTHYSDTDLQEMASEDSRKGGKGRANAVLVVSPEDLEKFYQSIPAEKLGTPIRYKEHLLDGNVPAILEGINPPKYHKMA